MTAASDFVTALARAEKKPPRNKIISVPVWEQEYAMQSKKFPYQSYVIEKNNQNDGKDRQSHGF
jgi:hypothetical protein